MLKNELCCQRRAFVGSLEMSRLPLMERTIMFLQSLLSISFSPLSCEFPSSAAQVCERAVRYSSASYLRLFDHGERGAQSTQKSTSLKEQHVQLCVHAVK